MTGTEWLLLALVILVPAAIAIAVTLWSLEQARRRSRKNRPRAGVRTVRSRAEETSGPVTSDAPPGAERVEVESKR